MHIKAEDQTFLDNEYQCFFVHFFFIVISDIFRFKPTGTVVGLHRIIPSIHLISHGPVSVSVSELLYKNAHGLMTLPQRSNLCEHSWDGGRGRRCPVGKGVNVCQMVQWAGWHRIG